jgi:restriction system protein
MASHGFHLQPLASPKVLKLGWLLLKAIKKDKSQLLVVELKKGRASDAVVGQVLRYMGLALLTITHP